MCMSSRPLLIQQKVMDFFTTDWIWKMTKDPNGLSEIMTIISMK